MINQHKVSFANTLRGIAAISVLISHYLGVFWLKRDVVAQFTNANVLQSSVNSPSIVAFVNFTDDVFNFGAFGVALFFLISGFVIPFSLNKLQTKEFIINRIFRIYPTYMVGFSLTLLIIFLSGKFYQHAFPYHLQEILPHFVPGFHDIYNTKIDGVIWTLDIEVKFYLICAVFVNLFKSKTLKVFFIPITLGILSSFIIAFFHHYQITNGRIFTYAQANIFIAQYIIYMFIGTVFYYNHTKRLKAKPAFTLIIALFILHAFIIKISPYGFSIGSYGCALSLFAFAYICPKFFQGNRVLNFFADISYPLYIIHGVSGYILLRILLDCGVQVYCALFITTMTALSFAYILHQLIERPSQALSRYFMKKQIKYTPMSLFNDSGEPQLE
jgi:peptidoglycan/LPS O-acetylase OafA/YrhL